MGFLFRFLKRSSYFRTIPNWVNKSFKKKNPKMEQFHRFTSMLESHEYDKMFHWSKKSSDVPSQKNKLSCPVELMNSHVTCVANEIRVQHETCHLQAAILRARFSFPCLCNHGSEVVLLTHKSVCLTHSEVSQNVGEAAEKHLLQCHAMRCGEGNGNPLQYSCLGNPMDGGAW